jgi:hypothetical protein
MRRRSEADDKPTSIVFTRSHGEANFPDVTPEVVQHGSGWAIWLAVILGGALGVFALTALIVSFLIQG